MDPPVVKTRLDTGFKNQRVERAATIGVEVEVEVEVEVVNRHTKAKASMT